MEKDKKMFDLKNKDFFLNVSMVLKSASQKLDYDYKVLIETCHDLSEKFEKMNKDYKLIRK